MNKAVKREYFINFIWANLMLIMKIATTENEIFLLQYTCLVAMFSIFI